MKNHAPYILLLCLVAQTLAAQAPTDSELNFKNGLYQNLANFQQDAPTHQWKNLDAEAHINTTSYEVKFDFIREEEGKEIDIASIWGVAIKGIPYIRVNPFLEKERLTTNDQDPNMFVRMQVVGKLCYFYYEAFVKEKVPITVFDPVTSQAIRTTFIEKDKPVVIKKLMRQETGEVVPYDLENFLVLIQESDPGLYKTLTDMEKAEARERLYKSLHIYNDRN